VGLKISVTKAAADNREHVNTVLVIPVTKLLQCSAFLQASRHCHFTLKVSTFILKILNIPNNIP